MIARYSWLLLALAGAASAQEAEFRWKGEVYSDLRFETSEKVPFERSESGASAEFIGEYGGHLLGKAAFEVIYTERGTANTFDELSSRQAIDPFRFESDALFVTFTDAGLDGLDISLGRKVVIWGTADRFHPTANTNALDVEDPLAFGEYIPTEMLDIRYSPYFTFGDEDDPWFEEFSIQAILVPFFKPAQLPGSARKAFTDVDEQIRLATTDKLKNLSRIQKGWLATPGVTNTYDIHVDKPEYDMTNAQVGVRMGWNFFGWDMSVSYFRGFDDFPRAEQATVTGSTDDIFTELHLTFPRVQVIGFDVATSLDWLDGVGLWAEVATTFHDELYVTIDGRNFKDNIFDEQTPYGSLFEGGPALEHGKGNFVKATVGMDYTPAPWLYMNVQYLRGFVDEFGTANLHDYLVAGMDFKMASDTVTLRLFGIVNFEDTSWVLFPQIIARPFNGAEISVGAFLFGSQFYGDTETKFGSPVAGASTVFAKVRALF